MGARASGRDGVGQMWSGNRPGLSQPMAHVRPASNLVMAER